MSKETTGHYSH